MARKPVKPFLIDEVLTLTEEEIEDVYTIRQEQLNGARIFSSRDEYAKVVPQGIRYMELGVSWGYSVEMFASKCNPVSLDLLDLYNQELKCWTQRKFGVCECTPRHRMEYDVDGHADYIREKFKHYPNVTLHVGDLVDILPKLDKEFDFIYFDARNERSITRIALKESSRMVPVGGVIGVNDYLIFDGVIENKPYGTYQSVHEFLHFHQNWVVDALALHNLGFYDIYLRRVS